MQDQLLTIDQTADYLSCSKQTVRRYIAAGELPAYRVGARAVRLRLADIDAMLRRIPVGEAL